MRYFGDDYDHMVRREEEDDPKWVNPLRTRDKWNFPYSYDEYFLFGDRAAIKGKGISADYSDRLEEWDRKKYSSLWEKHLKGHRWDNAPKEKLAAFLAAYQEKKVELLALAQGCNVSNGYPYWIVWYRFVK